MSTHKKSLTHLERSGLIAHGFEREIGRPSQLADVFRSGVAWALRDARKTRIIQELSDLELKALKLSDFIGESEDFASLDPEEQERLREQNDIMWRYFEALYSRLTANFPDHHYERVSGKATPPPPALGA